MPLTLNPSLLNIACIGALERLVEENNLGV
jgi:hypothetical protein